MIKVVMPEASATGISRGWTRWTCVSIPPGVAMKPWPYTGAVAEPISRSGLSTMSGLPARPTPTISPSFTPMLALRMPSTGSMTMTLLMRRSSSLAAGRRSFIMRPVRSVFPQPRRTSSP